MIFNSSHIDFIHGDIHGRSWKGGFIASVTRTRYIGARYEYLPKIYVSNYSTFFRLLTLTKDKPGKQWMYGKGMVPHESESA